MNKEQQQIIGDAYENYVSTHENFEWTDDFCKKNLKDCGDQWDVFSQEEFINKCKTDSEFSEKWGFRIEERELSQDERYDLCAAQKSKMSAISEEDYVKYNIPTRAISLMWNQRSVDTFLGLPFNIASYGLLLEIIAKEVNMVPDELIGNLGDVHLYSNHIEQAKEQISREPFELPALKIGPIFLANLEHNGFDAAVNGQATFELENYQSHSAIKAPLSS